MRSDNSLLTIDDWTYLSNLCHIYEESQLGSISQRLIDTHNNSASININYEGLIGKLSICGYETTGNYLRLNADICELS